LIRNKLTGYSLAGILVIIAIVYCMVANSEYEDSVEMSEMRIIGEANEKQFETSFFISAAIVNFVLAGLVIKSNRSVIPYYASAGVSAILIAVYVASRTVGVPVVGIEYYIGRLDLISKILQAVAIVLSGIAIHSIRKSKTLKELA
jgi:hypothetical protein